MAAKTFYITTPIYYVNDKPHIGHAYTTIAADVLARWHRLLGEDVFFLTGTDEHGEKIAKAAAEAGKTPKDFVDSIVTTYLDLWKEMRISNDGFIRTTDKRHEKAVTEFVEKMAANGDIYKGEYEGWHCVPDETFFTKLQLKDGKCPMCGREVKLIKEESYFFRLGKYQEKLLELYKANPAFLSPEFRSKEILNRVKEGLNDLSISRLGLSWGIPFPGDRKHTVYVWVDALINYLSALDWPGAKFKRYWPAQMHVVGKEINWFHSVIWPAMLMSAGIEPPQEVFAHGWWTIDGKKMSKSLGNAINPRGIIKKYGLDPFRYSLLRQMPFGEDGDFSEKEMASRINGELVDDLGNLVNRVMTLAERFDGEFKGKKELEEKLNLESIRVKMEKADLFGALEETWAFIRSSNKYINENEVWSLKDKRLGNALYNLLESIRIISILISAFMPGTAERISSQLGLPLGKLEDCKFREISARPHKSELLFKKIK